MRLLRTVFVACICSCLINCDDPQTESRVTEPKGERKIREAPESKPGDNEDSSEQQAVPGPCITEVDLETDGELDQVRKWTYEGRRPVKRVASDAGTSKTKEVVKWHYNEDGTVARKEFELAALGLDGSPDGKFVFDYDENGRRTRERIFQLGEVTADTFLSYDDAGRKVMEKTDNDGDGSPEIIRRFEYSGERLSREEEGTDGDDEADFVTIYQYEQGDKDPPRGPFEEADKVVTVNFDDDGNKIRETIFWLEDDGSVGRVETEKYSYECW